MVCGQVHLAQLLRVGGGHAQIWKPGLQGRELSGVDFIVVGKDEEIPPILEHDSRLRKLRCVGSNYIVDFLIREDAVIMVFLRFSIYTRFNLTIVITGTIRT